MVTKRINDIEYANLEEEFTKEDIVAKNKEILAESRARRKAQATESGSTQKVAQQSKASKRSTAKGGATFYTSEVSPTDFVPNPDKQLTAQTPDFYRNGRHEVITEVIDDQTITRRQWAPVPQLVADRLDPLLANIRLIDTRQRPNSDDPRSPGKRLIPEYSKFFLSTVQEAHREKYQMVETFNDWYVYFYGESPPIYSFSGHLLNLLNYNWWNEFMYYYENFWRGTKAVELGAKVFLTYNYQQIQGYILQVNTNLNAMTDKAAPFSFNMIVTKRLIFNGTGTDDVIRDNLLPHAGLVDINQSATPFAKQLVSTYLKNEAPAKDNKEVDDTNIDQSKKVIDKSSQSAKKQTTPSVNNAVLDSGVVPRGKAMATNQLKSLGIPSDLDTGIAGGLLG